MHCKSHFNVTEIAETSVWIFKNNKSTIYENYFHAVYLSDTEYIWKNDRNFANSDWNESS